MALRAARPGLTAARIAALTAALAFAAACGRGGDPSAEVIRGLQRAANRRDAGGITAALAPGFRGSGGATRQDVDAELRRLFAGYASVDVAVGELAIERFPGFDLARFRATFRGSARKLGGLEGILPASASWRFELRLARDGDRRTVTQATWEEIAD
jgi:hypothetical protein